MTSLAPIILFCYNRVEHLTKTIAALQTNFLAKDSNLIVYSDGPKNSGDAIKVNEVRTFLRTVSGFKDIKIIEHINNQGLAQSIINGVTEIVNHYGKVIVLEDDIVTSSYFLQYMNDGLNLYEKENEVISIHAYLYPVKKELPETFFIKGADCWGWGTWKRAWNYFEPNGSVLLEKITENKLIREFNFNNSNNYYQMLKDQIEGKNNSWAIRWYASAFLENKYTLYPGNSLVKNIGNDNSGTHSIKIKKYDVALPASVPTLQKIIVKENLYAKKQIENYFRSLNNPFDRLKNILLKLIKD